MKEHILRLEWQSPRLILSPGYDYLVPRAGHLASVILINSNMPPYSAGGWWHYHLQVRSFSVSVLTFSPKGWACLWKIYWRRQKTHIPVSWCSQAVLGTPSPYHTTAIYSSFLSKDDTLKLNWTPCLTVSPSSAQWFIPKPVVPMGRGLLLSSVLDFCLDPNFFILMRKITKETSVRRNTGLSTLALAWPLLSHYRT